MTEPAPVPNRGRRFFRFCAWSVAGLVVLALALSLTIATLIGTRISAPDWLRDRITQNINMSLDDLTLEVGDVSVLLESTMIPRVGLRNVVLHDATGERLARLDDVQSTVALDALLRGALRPASIQVSGMQFRVRRSEAGSVGFTVGAGEETTGRSAEYSGVRMGIHDAVAEADTWLNTPQFRNLSLVELTNITLRYEDERAGRAWTADGVRLSLTRTGDDLALRGDAALLGGGAFATTLAMNYTGRVGEVASELGISFEDMPAQDIAGQSPALAWLSALDAPISGALRAQVVEDGALGPLHATLQIGEGSVRPEGGARPVMFNSARTYFTYRPDEQSIDFSEVSVDSDWVRAEASGVASLEGMETGWPSALGVQFKMEQIEASPGDLYPEPILLERAEMDVRLALDPFVLDLKEAKLFDQGEVLTVTGLANAKETGWEVALKGGMAGIAPDRLMELWPAALVPKTRKWILKNIRQIALSDIEFSFDGQPSEKPSVFVGFDFADFNARFMRDVPPIEAAHGYASLDNTRFVVTAEGGHVTTDVGGQIDITGTRFIIPKTNVKRTPAEVHLEASAPITAALSFLDERPFGYMSRAGLPVDLAEGRAEVAGVLNFRMVDKLHVRDVKFGLDGALYDVRTDQLMKGRVLNVGRLDLKTSHEGLRLEGAGQIGEVPFDGRYEMAFGPDPDPETAMGSVRGEIELSERFLEEFSITLPPGSLTGEGRAAVEIDLRRDAPAVLRLQSDLQGVDMRLDALGWRKPASSSGKIEIAGSLGAQPEIDRIEIDAPGLRASGALGLRTDGALDRARFSRVQAGDWLDAPVELVGRGRGNAPLVRVVGGQVDLRDAPIGKGNGNGKGGPLSLQLDRLTISDGLAVTGFRADITTAGGAAGPFSGRLNGLTMITGQMIPQNGRTSFRIRSEDAGGFFASAGLIKQARNGVLELSLVPGNGQGVWEGSLSARGGMRLKDAPTVAAMLNAVSVVGLLEQLGGDGIHFEEVDARFQIAPERVTLYSMSAVGASMGISMDGYFYPSVKQMDLQGVVSPFYLFNAVGGVFTRRGEGLFGFSFDVRGAAGSPEVSVNPLSALTPGLFRELFRRPPPQRSVTRDALPTENGLADVGGASAGEDADSADKLAGEEQLSR